MNTKSMKKSRRASSTNIYSMRKLKFKFDKDVLEMFIGYIFSEDKMITKLNLNNLQKLMKMTDERTFELDAALNVRFNIIVTALDGKLQQGIDRPSLLKEYCRRLNDPECEEVLNHVSDYTKLTKREIKFLTEGVTHRLQFGCIEYYRDLVLDQFMRIDQGQFKSFREVALAIKDVCTQLINDMRVAESVQNDVFTLKDDVFEQFVTDAVEHASDPNTAIMTGIKALNDMLSPGWQQCRLYLVIALSGTFKSSFLIYVAYWAKKYNRIPPRNNPNARAVVLFYLLENDIEETIVRLFNICASTEDISKFTPKEVIKMMREKGGLTLNDGELDFEIRYAASNVVSPNDIATDIETLADDNREVVLLVVDYIKRMRSDFPAPDDRIKLRDISNGLKDVLIRYKIPGVTAQQINRSGTTTIDAAMESGKQDLTRYLGRSNIADSWDLFENVDWCAIINIEIERNSGHRFLTVKEIKKRYRSMTDITYFNHPFVEGSTIMLVDDVGMEKSISKTSLSADMMGLPDSKKPPTKKVHSNNINDMMYGLTDSSDLISSK